MVRLAIEARVLRDANGQLRLLIPPFAYASACPRTAMVCISAKFEVFCDVITERATLPDRVIMRHGVL